MGEWLLYLQCVIVLIPQENQQKMFNKKILSTSPGRRPGRKMRKMMKRTSILIHDEHGS